MFILANILKATGPVFYLFPVIIYVICKLANRNLELEEGFASFEIRALAYIIDVALVFCFNYLVAFIFSIFMKPPTIILVLLAFLFTVTNILILPTITGWSLGKRIVGIRIIKKDQKKAEFFDVVYREIVKSFFSVPLIYLGCLWMLFGQGKLTWHDSVADIRVVKIAPMLHEKEVSLQTGK